MVSENSYKALRTKFFYFKGNQVIAFVAKKNKKLRYLPTNLK
jgi:hypothetical protein